MAEIFGNVNLPACSPALRKHKADMCGVLHQQPCQPVVPGSSSLIQAVYCPLELCWASEGP